MKLSRTVAYSVQSILQLAHAPAGLPIACSQLAAEGRMPERFLLQILRKLVRHGVLRSHRGVDGGYVLARPVEEITLLELVESFDHSLTPGVPPLEGLPDGTRNRLQQTLERSYAAVRAELETLRMSDLLQASDEAPQNAFAAGRIATTDGTSTTSGQTDPGVTECDRDEP